MLRKMLTATTLIALSTTAGAACPDRDDSPSPAAVERAAVLAVMDRYLAAISADDLATMKSLQTPDGMTYRARANEDGSMEVVAHPNAYWVDPARKDGHTRQERYWTPTVLVRGSIAVVWAPYEFRIDGKTSHCGIDSFDFVKVDGRWLVANAMWTVEPEACAALRPPSSAEMRPAG